MKLWQEIKWWYQERNKKKPWVNHNPFPNSLPLPKVNPRFPKDIDEKVKIKNELDTIRKIIRNWVKSYISLIDPNHDNLYLLEDIEEEINLCVMPYLNRFIELKYLTQEELISFLKEIDADVLTLKDAISKKCKCDKTKCKKGGKCGRESDRNNNGKEETV